MLSNEAKIEGITSDVRNMANDIHDIKTMLKEQNRDTREILRTLAAQGERISLIEAANTGSQKKIEGIQLEIEDSNRRISDVETTVTRVRYYIAGAGAAGAFLFYLFSKTMGFMKVFL